MTLNCNYTVSHSDLGKKCIIVAKLTSSDAIQDYKLIIIVSYTYCGVYFLNAPPILVISESYTLFKIIYIIGGYVFEKKFQILYQS